MQKCESQSRFFKKTKHVKFWRALLSWKIRFEIPRFALLQTNFALRLEAPKQFITFIYQIPENSISKINFLVYIFIPQLFFCFNYKVILSQTTTQELLSAFWLL